MTDLIEEKFVQLGFGEFKCKNCGYWVNNKETALWHLEISARDCKVKGDFA